MDNPEALSTLSTQDTGQINIRENRKGNQEWTIQRHSTLSTEVTWERNARENRGDNQEWTIQRHCQHWVHRTQDTYTLEKTEGAIKNGQSRDTGSIEYARHRKNKRLRKPNGQSRMDNPETLSTLSTRETGQVDVRENRRDKQEWTIQRHCQHWVHKSQDT